MMGLLVALIKALARRPDAVPGSWHLCCACLGKRTELVAPTRPTDLAAGARYTACTSCAGIGWHAYHR